MPALVAGIHAIGSPPILRSERNVSAWMAGTSPAMTALAAHPRASAIITAPISITAAPSNLPLDSSFSTCPLASTVKSADRRLMAMT